MVAAVAAGGAVGTLGRWWILEAFDRFGWSVWAFLFVVNVAGAFLLGWFGTRAAAREAHPVLVAFTAAGLLGSFTTFSSFTVAAVDGVRTGDAVVAGGFVAVSLVGGVAAAVTGRVLAVRP